MPNPKNTGPNPNFTIKRALDGQRETSPATDSGPLDPYITYCPKCKSTTCSHTQTQGEQ